MADRWERATEGYSFRFFSPEQADEILRDGCRRGRAGSHAAIERILKHEPGVARAELWRRIRQLKFSAVGARSQKSSWTAQDDEILSRGYEKDWSEKRAAVRELLRRHPDWRPHVIWKRAAKLGLVQKTDKHRQDRLRSPWSEHENQLLLNLAGYKPARKIARVLHRSEAAVRDRLAFLGKSSRVHLEGFSRQELALNLHLGKKTIQRLIVEGLLQVRDPRITRESIDLLRQSGLLETLRTPSERTARSPSIVDGERSAAAAQILLPAVGLGGAPTRPSRAERVWSEIADSLNVPLATVKRLLANRVLRLYDPTITEKSLRDLCRRYGSMINCESLNRETRDWLHSAMDLAPSAGESISRRLAPFRRHSRVVRHCAKCGRSIRGNAFFRHSKKCAARLPVRTDAGSNTAITR